MKLFEATNGEALAKLAANHCMFLRSFLDYPLRPDADMDTFTDLCQGMFISTLTRSNPKLSTDDGYTLTLHYDQSKGGTGGEIKEREKFSNRNPYLFNFRLNATYDDDGSSTTIGAQDILDGEIKLLKADGSEDTQTLDTLKQIRRAYVSAQRDLEGYKAKRNDENTREREKRERERARQEQQTARQEAEEALNNAIDAGDAEQIRIALERLEELDPARIRVREIARQAEAGTDTVLTSDETMKECNELGIADPESFLCGWLAANVERMFAYIPYTVTKLGRQNNRFLHAFQASFGNCPERATKEEAKALGGYALTPFSNDDLDAEVAKNRKAGGINQKFIALYVHFRNYAVKKAPRFVQVWLASHRSLQNEIAIPGATIQRNSLVCHLFSEFGFPIAAADDSARDHCKAKANDLDSFTAGFAWPVRLDTEVAQQPARVPDPEADTPKHELDLDFPEPEITTASDYDVEPVAPF